MVRLGKRLARILVLGASLASGVGCAPELEFSDHCADGEQNSGETDIDCGGSCDGCETDQTCLTNADCLHDACVNNICGGASCFDTDRNGSETDVDCGGGCPKCEVGRQCERDADCVNDECVDGVCQGEHCTDGALSGDETDEDCGGSCEPCEIDESCVEDTDCRSKMCVEGVCAEASCDDRRTNGSETDVDCGGPDADCARCEDGDDCDVDGDCASNFCNASGTCGTPPTCDDDTTNGGETGVDCGGSTTCPRCGVDQPCDEGSDCRSGLCGDDGRCEAVPTCDDEIQNGDETDVDCGGPNPDCKRCVPGDLCAQGSDCDAGVCTDGRCDITCSAGTANCDENLENGCETAVSGDIDNCGGCDDVCNLSHAVAVCNDGSCGIEFVDGQPSCDDGWADCDGQPENGCEINLHTELDNCGSCDNVCEVLGGDEFGTPLCDDGACSATCNAPYEDCEPDPITVRVYECETNTQVDPANCDGCGNDCPKGTSAAVCRNGICGLSTCDYPNEDCDLDDPDCEADLTSLVTCGDCATSCAPQNVVTALCTSSGCDYDECRPGYGDCDGSRANGCEEHLTSSNLHCGACGSTCPRDGTNVLSASCVAGVCEWTSCASGFDNCDTDVDNGCETPIDTVTDCGDCDQTCSSTGITRACDGGECTGTCTTDRADCNGNKRTDGCEINTATDVDHCGGCGQECSESHITVACNGGACTGACISPYRDCNNDKRTDGCEADINTSVRNCGTCGDACSTNHITRHCTDGDCDGACDGDYVDCNDDKRTDGCEINTATDAANCGDCGDACSTNHITTPHCTGGDCDGTCATDFGDCNNDKRTDGCEINTATDPVNCGDCGDACSTSHITRHCTGGSCDGTCTSPYLDCNGDKRTDGCEADPQSDANNCGGCGKVCSGLTPTCSGGNCTGKLRVTYKGGQQSDDEHVTGDNQIEFSVALCNDGTSTVTLSNVRLRYWFTRDGLSINGVFGGTYEYDSTYQSDYIQVVITNGSLGAGACTSSYAVNVVAGSCCFNEANDFSRPSSVPKNLPTVDNAKVTLYQGTTYVQGQRPPLP